nr:hypothetical protein [Tanacetum cinerariifolium]
RNIQLIVNGFHSPPDDDTRKLKLFPEGKTTDPKESGGNNQPADKGLSSMTDAKYQVDQTHSNRFKVSVSDQHKSNTSSEVELDFEPLKLTTTFDIQALLGAFDDDLKEDSKDDVFESISLHHQTGISLKSSNAKKTEALDSDSSSCFESLKPYKNYMPINERKLVSNLQNFSKVIYAQVFEDHYEKHKDAAASYDDLKSKIEGFHDATYKAHEETNTALNNYEKLITQFKNHTKKNVGQIFSSLKVICDVVKEDPALNKKVIKATLKPTPRTQQTLLRFSPWFINCWGKNFAHTSTKEPPSHTKRKRADMDTKEAVEKEQPKEPEDEKIALKVYRVKGIATNDVESPKKMVKALSKVRPDPDEPVRVLYEIHGKLYHLTNDEIQEHLDKEEKMKKAGKEAKLLAMSKLELIKVLHEEASKATIDPKIL